FACASMDGEGWRGREGVSRGPCRFSVERQRCISTNPNLAPILNYSGKVMHIYEVRPRKAKRGVDLISDVLPFGRLWYDTPDNALGYGIHSSRLHDAVIRVYADAGRFRISDSRHFAQNCMVLRQNFHRP